jgi:hypothetical protein
MKQPAVEIFISYAREDEAWRNELAKHLKSLEWQGVIKAWHDRKITAGEEWKSAIDSHLESAKIILLLISADFLASDYCYDIELQRALERHESKEARVIPVILRSGEAAISRGNCFNSGSKLVALAPKFSQKGLNGGEFEEQSVWGKTAMEYPTVWFFVPFGDRSTQLEFVLQNREDEVIYSSMISTPSQDGVVGVKIPKSQKPLVLDRHYRWTLKAKFGCGESAPEQRYVDGWIQRVGLPAGVDVASNPDRGIWYDAVTSLAERRSQEPNNVQLKQDWRELLKAVNLEMLAVQPLLK